MNGKSGTVGAKDGFRHENNFGAIRLLLALFVVVAHSAQYTDGDLHRELLTSVFHTLNLGEVAVRGFFALSGCLLCRSWLRQPEWKPFLRNRVLRIYPGFAAATLATVLIFAPLGSGAPRSYLHSVSPVRLVVGILCLRMPVAPPSFPGNPFPLLNGAMWTILPEFMCYLLILGAGACGGFRKRWIWPVAAVIVYIASVILPTSGPILPHLLGPGGNRLPLLLSFLMGINACLFQKQIRFTPAGAAAAVGLWAAAMFQMQAATAATAICGTYLLFALGFARAPRLRMIGQKTDLSYGIYLYASPIMHLWRWRFPQLSAAGLCLLTAASAVAVAFASWHLIEKPALSFKAKPLAGAPPTRTPAGGEPVTVQAGTES